MFPVSPIVAFIFVIAYAATGMLIGVVTGWLASLVTKHRRHGLLPDAILGSIGFLLGFFACAFTPWPRNTISYHEGGTLVTSTANRYQHPEVAIVVALLFPLIYELYRHKRARSN